LAVLRLSGVKRRIFWWLVGLQRTT
jgi:hypothetical protein